MDTNLCEIIVLLDRSGSMDAIKDDMMGGFDSFVKEQRSVPGACVLTLVQFDSFGIDTVHEAKPIADVPALLLEPRGMTPLLDAVGRTINDVGQRLERTPEDKRPGRVLFVIVTDGHENASKEFKLDQIKSMVEHQTNTYQWQFSYLGANVDAFAEAGGLGIGRQSSSPYAPTPAGVAAMYTSLSEGATAYRTGDAYTISDEDRKKMQP